MLRIMCRTVCSLFLMAAFSLAQQSSPAKAAPGSAQDLVAQGEKLSRQGQQDAALAMYARAFDKAGDLYEAHLAAGEALDLKGDYDSAREHFNKAIELAPADSRAQALRAMAISYAFQSDAAKASEFELRVFTARSAREDFVGAAETCNEMARIYLESGDVDNADKWYKLGYDTIGRKTDLTEADKNLWMFRWESAQARLAVRRGRADEARQHVVAAKAALDKANNPEQARFYPYLTGYVAFYAGDYKAAIAELPKADQHDPFNLVLLGEAFEKAGDAAQAKSYYRKVLEINVHNPTNAFARPLAQKKLGGA